MSEFVVISAGIHTLIEDLGRKGFYSQGLSGGGPADELSFRWANRLCGNRANTSALEITYGGLVLEATANTCIATAGATMPFSINAKPAEQWRSYSIAKGSRIAFGMARHGLRCYLAVRGGLLVKPMFGSTATVCRERLGGIDGRALQKGDRLAFTHGTEQQHFQLPASLRPTMADNSPLRLLLGWHYRQFSPQLKRAFFQQSFQLAANSNRQGMRLEGPPLPTVNDSEFLQGNGLSEGVLVGTVQIPADGLPIIMHRDHQTIGGYKKLGTVVSADLNRLAQLAAGSTIRFQPISLAGARQLLIETHRHFEKTQPLRVANG